MRDNDGALSNVATVSITVNAVNDAPVAGDDSATTDEDTPVHIGVLANDTDVEGDALTPVVVSGPSHGTVTLNADGSFTYTPDAELLRPRLVHLQGQRRQADSNVATVSLTVNPVNDAPVAVNDGYSTDEDTPVTVAAPGVLDNDTDVENDSLDRGPGERAEPRHADAQRGRLVHLHAGANYFGSDSFTYKTNDGALDTQRRHGRHHGQRGQRRAGCDAEPGLAAGPVQRPGRAGDDHGHRRGLQRPGA